MQQDRHDPYPWTWEPAIAGALAASLILLAGVHLGRAAACLVSGYGIQITPRDAVFSSTWPILTGDASAGLADPMIVPSSTLAISILATEVVLLAVSILAAVWVLRRWGPLALKGVASSEEAAQLLGVQRLRKNRKIIRPDLYGAARRRRGSTGAKMEMNLR